MRRTFLNTGLQGSTLRHVVDRLITHATIVVSYLSVLQNRKEQGTVKVTSNIQPIGNRVPSAGVRKYHPFLVALTNHLDDARLNIERLDVEARDFGASQASYIKESDNNDVANAGRTFGRLAGAYQRFDFTKCNFTASQIPRASNHFHVFDAPKIIRRHALEIKGGFSRRSNRRQRRVDARVGFASDRLQVLSNLQHVLVAKILPGDFAEVPVRLSVARLV